MSFRARLAIATAAAVAAAILVSFGAGYLLVRNQLRGQVDHGLRDRAAALVRLPPAGGRGGPPKGGEPAFGGPPGFAQLVTADGVVQAEGTSGTTLPVDDRVRAVARGVHAPFLADATVSGTQVRILTTPFRTGVALQIARPFTEEAATLRHLRVIGLLAALVGVALAALAGLVVARTASAPVRRLTDAAEEIARTGDPGRRVGLTGRDELGRLGAAFDVMLATLDDSLHAQRQLIADASHELRTPLTSLRTNVELLARGGLSEPEHRQAFDDVALQIGELTTLIEDVVDLARDGEPERAHEEVRLDLLAADAVQRARRHAPTLTFTTELAPTLVSGVADRLGRAVANLLDNAARWSPKDGHIEVTVSEGELTVRDHGPGIDPADLPHVFDRFYRAPVARKHPGSGLGLAIVQRVAAEHGATATAENAADGGACLRIRFSPTS